MLPTEDAAREAFQSSVLELTRDQLDREYNRDAFWSDTIAKLFNDPNYRPFYSFHGVVEGIDTSEPPTVTRDGPYLKRQYRAARKCFSVAYHNWSKSGHNDRDLFCRFNLLRRYETLTSDGEKALVVFHVLRCGTKFLDQSLMDCIYRGIGGSCSRDFENGAKVASVEPRRKRRWSSSASQSETDFESVKEIVNYATTKWSKSVAVSEQPGQGTTSQLDDDVDRTIFHVNKLRELTKALSEADKLSNCGPEDTREMWKTIYVGVLAKFRDFHSFRSTACRETNSTNT